MACCMVAAYVIMRMISIGDSFKSTSLSLEQSVFGQSQVHQIAERRETAICRLKLTGITCAACVNSIEKALQKAHGVHSAVVSMVLSQAIVSYSPSYVTIKEMISKVEDVGYGAEEAFSECHTPSAIVREADELRAQSIRSWALSTIGATAFTLPIIVTSVLPVARDEILPRKIIIEAVLCGMVVLFFSRQIHLEAVLGLWKWRTDMSLLSSLGTILAYTKSLHDVTFGYRVRDSQYLTHTSFDSTAVLACVIIGGRFLKAKVARKSTASLHSLAALMPEVASLLIGDFNDVQTAPVPVESVEKGDRVVVCPGDIIPSDGIVISGTGNVSETYLTGELLPQFKRKGSSVFTGSVSQDGQLIIEASGNRRSSWLQNTLQLMSDGDSRKSSAQETADFVASWFVSIVIFFSCFIGMKTYYFTGHTFSRSLDTMISVLLAACPCALGLGTPTAVMIGINIASRANVFLLGGSRAVEAASRIKTIIFDKTGTLTSGTMQVQDVFIPSAWKSSQASQIDWWSAVLAVEDASKHPVAQGIVTYARRALTELYQGHEASLNSLCSVKTQNFVGIAGLGASCNVLLSTVDGLPKRSLHISIGSRRYIESIGIILNMDKGYPALLPSSEKLNVVETFVAIDGTFAGCVRSHDEIRPEARETIGLLKRRGYNVGMMTGSVSSAAHAVAQAAGIESDWVWASLMPEDKLRCIEQVKKLHGPVAMVGDNLNDIQAMSSSDFCVAAFVDASSITAAAADALLVNGSISNFPEGLLKVPYLFELSNEVFSKIKQNLTWAIMYNFLAVVLGSGLLFGLSLNPIYAGLGMSLSSTIVLVNTMRLEKWTPQSLQSNHSPVYKSKHYIPV